jgi:hypothetical protein
MRFTQGEEEWRENARARVRASERELMRYTECAMLCPLIYYYCPYTTAAPLLLILLPRERERELMRYTQCAMLCLLVY